MAQKGDRLGPWVSFCFRGFLLSGKLRVIHVEVSSCCTLSDGKRNNNNILAGFSVTRLCRWVRSPSPGTRHTESYPKSLTRTAVLSDCRGTPTPGATVSARTVVSILATCANNTHLLVSSLRRNHCRPSCNTTTTRTTTTIDEGVLIIMHGCSRMAI